MASTFIGVTTLDDIIKLFYELTKYMHTANNYWAREKTTTGEIMFLDYRTNSTTNSGTMS
jgi:hypothetical protein